MNAADRTELIAAGFAFISLLVLLDGTRRSPAGRTLALGVAGKQRFGHQQVVAAGGTIGSAAVACAAASVCCRPAPSSAE